MVNMVAAFKLFFPRIKIDVERWKFNEEAQLYVSNHGRIRRKNGDLLEFKVRRDNGYISIHTKESGFWSVHQLVAQTWIPNDDPKKNTVDHLDHNKRNNRVDNLEWCTVTENRSRANRDLCYDPDEAERLINQYKSEITNQRKEIKRLTEENTKLQAICPQNTISPIVFGTEINSDTIVAACNGIPVTARELSLISMAGSFGARYTKRLSNFVSSVNKNESVRIGGMTFTHI